MAGSRCVFWGLALGGKRSRHFSKVRVAVNKEFATLGVGKFLSLTLGLVEVGGGYPPRYANSIIIENREWIIPVHLFASGCGKEGPAAIHKAKQSNWSLSVMETLPEKRGHYEGGF